MKTNHTKGEWSFEDFYTVPDKATVFIGNGTSQFTDVIGRDAKANAKLIAAAPELLEALINLIDNAEFDRHIENGEQFGLSEETSLLIRNAQKAIKKATGQ